MAGDLATTDHVPPAVAAPELDVGTRLGERYRLVQRLGGGGGGTVWRVFDEKVGEELALKLVDTAADLERWRREVALARRISHPGVCRVYDLGEAVGRRWVTMALVEGRNLRARIEEGIADGERPGLMQQLVDAVAAIHAAGVVHRDLKPENVVVDRDDRAVIVDFGLARTPTRDEGGPVGATGSVDGEGLLGAASPTSDTRITVDGAVVGTPRYMAPEQARGGVADARSDVYSLGLVLHEIAGGAGWSRDDVPTTNGRGQARAALAPIGGPWGDVIARATAAAPADRFADAGAIAAVIAAAASTVTPAAAATTPAAAATTTPADSTVTAATGAGLAARAAAVAAVRRRRAIGAAIAGVSIAGAAAAVVALGGGDRARGRAPWPAGPLQVRRLTTSLPEQQPASVVLSGDGQTIAYTVGAALFVRPIDGGVPTPMPLPTTPELARARLAFVLGIFADGRFLIEVLDRDKNWGVWTIGGAREPQLLWPDTGRIGAALSPDGTQVAIASRDRGVVVMSSEGGPSRRIATVEDGARVGGVAWSPDGTQIAFVRYPPDGSDDTLEVVAADGGARRVLVRAALASPTDQLVAWPAPDRIVYAATASGGGAALAAVHLGGAQGGAPVELVRWPGEHVGIGAYGGGRLALLRGTSRDQLVTTKLYAATGNPAAVKDDGPGSAVARHLAGVLPDGRAVFASPSATGDHDVIARAGDGTSAIVVAGPADDLPDTVADGAILYHRVAGTTIEVWRHAPGAADVRIAEVPHDGAAADVIRCAGDRTAPCVLEELDGASRRYLRIDPVTGARGAEVHRAPRTGRFRRGMAVAPDGGTLAVVDGSSGVTLIDLDDGGQVRHEVAPGAELQAVAWAGDGQSLLVSTIGGGDHLFNLFRVKTDGEARVLLKSNYRWFARAHEAPEGKALVAQARDVVVDVWLAEGI